MQRPMINKLLSLEQFINEVAKNQTFVVGYPGKFQPFHYGHDDIYKLLVKKFGKENVYITTADLNPKNIGKGDYDENHFLTFDEKKMIMTKIFKIPDNKIVKVANNYAPKELTGMFTPDTAYITVVGGKDAERLGKGKYFEEYSDDKELQGYFDKGYYYIQENRPGVNMSATEIRDFFRDPKNDQRTKENFFKKIFGKFDAGIFNMIDTKLNANVVNESSNKHKIKIVSLPDSSVPAKILLQKFCLLRNAEKVGDIEVVNNTQLGRLKDNDVEYEILKESSLYPDRWKEMDGMFMGPGEFKGLAEFDAKWKAEQLTETATRKDIDNILKKYKRDYNWGRENNIEVHDKEDVKNIENLLRSADIQFSQAQYLFGSYYIKLLDIRESSVNESGAFGHLEHIYDDYTLTFAQLKELVNLTLSGKLKNAVEKTDGVALAVSYKDDKLVTARNKSEYKNFGEKAADKNAIKEKFAGRGEISDAYNYAFEDLEKAISKLSKKDVDEIFKNGKAFMHLEVMYIPTTNTVPYNVNLLVFHNVTEYDESGEPISQDRKAADKIAELIKGVNQDVQKTFKIEGSPYIKLKDGVDFEKEKKHFIDKITKLQTKWGLSDKNTLLDFYAEEWKAYLEKNGINNLTEEQLHGLIARWSGINKAFRLNAKTIPNPETLQWAEEFEKGDAKKVNTDIKRIIETLFIEVAMVVIRSLQTFLAANPEESAKQLRKDLEKAIEDIKKSGDESALDKLKKHLERLEMVGGMDAVFPSEGLVFDYRGKMYKLTGSFTDVHHIISTLKYKK